MKGLIVATCILVGIAAHSRFAFAHSWYSEKKDPVTHISCCGGHDCAAWRIQPGEYTLEADGVRVRLSEERTRTINPYSVLPIDALVIWDRVQPSEDGNYHLCISPTVRNNERGGIYCLFAPPST